MTHYRVFCVDQMSFKNSKYIVFLIHLDRSISVFCTFFQSLFIFYTHFYFTKLLLSSNCEKIGKQCKRNPFYKNSINQEYKGLTVCNTDDVCFRKISKTTEF